MAHARALGDSHNFGRRVSVRGDRIVKPRTLTWERLVLSSRSPLRRVLAQAAARAGHEKTFFDFLPDLAFFPSKDGIGGEVERVSLAPLGRLALAERGALADLVGRFIALFAWLGVTDLHWENLVIGREANGRIIFAPLDVEMILADLSLPTETKLIPDADPEYAELSRHAAGVRRVLPFLGKPVPGELVVRIVAAYDDTLGLLDASAREIAEAFAALPDLKTAPIRVCLRATGEYVGGDIERMWPPLLDEERAQLARGDVPYFFRRYGERGIHFFADASLRTIGTLPLEGDVPQLDPILPVARGLRAPSRKKLRDEGTCTVFGAFDSRELAGRYEHERFAIEVARRSIVIAKTGEGGFEIEARRDMRAFVSDVYLPCHCGEVRSVFVPAVTKCE